MTAPHAELALRVLLPSFSGPSLPPAWAGLLADGLGGVCLFGSNVTGRTEDVAALTAAVHAARPEALVAVDEEGGDVTRLHATTGSPVLGPAALGAVDDLDLTAATGRAVGAELAAVGVGLDLGPVADVNSNPANPVIGTRSFGADPALVARHVAAWARGLQEHGVAACVKHFPGHGDTAQDSHLTLPVLDAPSATVRARELVPFAAAVDAGVAAVMTSHLLVPALDPDRPATFSPTVLGLLREDLGFDGVVVSDALDMAGASAGTGVAEAAVLALAAGADLLCVGPDKDAALVGEIRSAVIAAVRSGRLPEQRLVEAAGRVDRLRAGLPYGGSPGSAATAPAPEALADAARRALLVEGTLPDLSGARVVSVATPANIAVGEAAWGIAPDVVVGPGEALPDGPLVVQVRDAHRHPEVAAALAAVSAPAVEIEWGWPAPRRPEGRRTPRICTRGSSRPAVAAVERVIGEAGWSR